MYLLGVAVVMEIHGLSGSPGVLTKAFASNG